jgi:hypothetical protein
MPTPKRSHRIGFAVGIILAVGLPFAEHRFPILRAVLFYSVSIGTLLCLPFIFAIAKKDAVPAKPSDFIGYAVILAVVLAIGGAAYAVLK